MIVLVAASLLGTLELIGLIVVAIVALGVVVFAHEWGHFMAGRRAGIRAEAFSIGFGPILWRKTIGETEYRLSAILFGGYVKFAGMEGTPDKTPQEIERGFYAATPERRIFTTFAGPFMNAVLAFALFFILWGTGRKVPQGEATTVIGGTEEGSAAEEAGLQPGDRILSIDGRPVSKWYDVMMGVALGPRTLDVEIERARRVIVVSSSGRTVSRWQEIVRALASGKPLRVQVKHKRFILHKQVRPKEHPKAGARVMGVAAEQPIIVYRVQPGTEAERMGLQKGDLLLQLDHQPIYSGAAEWQKELRERAGSEFTITVERAGKPLTLTGTMPRAKGDEPPVLGFVMARVYVWIWEDPVEASAYCFNIMGRTLKGLLTRRVKAKGLSGPVGIVGVITYSLRVSFTSFLWWAAFISLSLAVINLLPIPVVDGGHIMFSIIEKIRRKPVREKTMAIVTNVFAVLIIAFFLYVTFHDVKRFIPSSHKDNAEDKTPPAEQPEPKPPEPEPPPPEAPPH